MTSTIYLDANVFIYFIEGEPSVAYPLRDLFEALRRNPLAAVTSELTLAETLAPPRRPGAVPLSAKRGRYLDLLLNSRIVRLMPIDRDILIETAELRNVANHRLADAIHVVSAIRSRCRYFVSGDSDAKRLPAEIKWIVPNENGVQTLLEALA